MAEAYCVKDKMKVEIQNPQKITMKNGKPATKGTCPKCGGKRLPDRRLTPASSARATAPSARGARCRGESAGGPAIGSSCQASASASRPPDATR